MTETPSQNETKPKRKGLFFFPALLVLSFVAGAALEYVLPAYVDVPQIAAPLPGKFLELQARVEKLEKQMAETPAASAPAAKTEEPGKLKENLAALSGAMEELEKKIGRSAEEADRIEQKAQNGLAVTLAFVEMQKKALEGRPFEEERQTLRRVAQEDPKLIDLLLKLEPVALKGAETPQALRADWRNESVEAQAALRKAAAQTWQDRVAVALENLVSVRSLRPEAGAALSFTAVDLDLARGDLRAALEKVASLPPEVQEKIAAWRGRAEARLKMEDDLDSLVAFMIARGQKGEAPPAAPADEAKP